MTKTRIKKKVITDVTREQAEQAFAELAAADASNKKISAEIDLAFTKIREKYQEKIAANSTVIEERTELLETWLRENPDVLGKKKSVDLSHGTIGYRLGQHSIKVLKGMTLKACETLVKQFISSDYIRTKEELDKEKLLADRDEVITSVLKFEEGDAIWQTPEEQRPLLKSLFDKCGFEVKQDETFYIEPKKEELEAVNI